MKLRHFLLGAALAGAAFSAEADSPRYIFYFIGDGMGMGPVQAAQNYNRMVLKGETPLTMMQFPVVGWCQTWSASSPITDSAAAGTALSTGTKTLNGMLGMDPDTTSVTSIARILKDHGFGVGVATSVAPDDATPGAFYAHVPHRKMFAEIDSQMAVCGYDFLAGGGLQGLKDKDGKPNGVEALFAANNVSIARGAEAFAKVSGKGRVLLVNPEGVDGVYPWNISYTIDSVAGALTLPIITEAALEHLEKVSPERFFMMVEGGNIDHALHANDGGAAIKEILNFDSAIAVAFDFYKKHPEETLIVVTADHDTGGLAYCHPRGGAENPLSLIDRQKVSKEAFSDYCKALLRSRRIYTWDDMKEYLTENFGFFTHVPVSEAQEKKLKEKFDSTFELRNSEDQKTLYANFNAFAVEVFRVLNDAVGFNFTTTSHSGNPVPVFAVGAGADEFKGFNNNCELPGRILRIALGSDAR